ncbi:PTS system, mannose-specific IID component [Sporolactobacillus inulinus]|uniref:PTS system, mannose-specific IID component n=1 Tax=Sporolactobacillus inulinus TaxID=2078 RepID=A0A4Y1ZIC6_9BACL|nr:PTS system, mannose-specific IID component [Sporolactobacillus inulinus]
MSKLTNVSKEEEKMLRKTFWRAFTLFTAVTPAKQGASGFCYSMMPFIDHFYKMRKRRKRRWFAIWLTSTQRYRCRPLLWASPLQWKKRTARIKTLTQIQLTRSNQV